MMTFLLALGPESPPQVPRSRGVCVLYKFIKCTTIPGGKSKLDWHANIFGAREYSDVLQDN